MGARNGNNLHSMSKQAYWIAKDVLETEQQQWLDMREQAALDTPIFLVTDMTKMRTYDLISFYFDDHFYD